MFCKHVCSKIFQTLLKMKVSLTIGCPRGRSNGYRFEEIPRKTLLVIICCSPFNILSSIQKPTRRDDYFMFKYLKITGTYLELMNSQSYELTR